MTVEAAWVQAAFLETVLQCEHKQGEGWTAAPS